MRYYLSDDELRAVQMVQLELLKEVRRICELHDIKFTIIAGTQLGAVRHGGYIPWDDDADVAMLRSEYERFKTVCAESLDAENYYFQDHVVTEGYRWGYGKLRKKNTLFLREGQEHMPYEQGIFIDIFPLDYVSENRLLRTVQNFHCYCIRKFLWSKVGQVIDKSAVKRAGFALMAKLPEKMIKKHLDAYIKKCNRKKSKWVRILMFPTPNKEYAYLAKWYEELTPTEFEGEIFPGMIFYDEYLSFKFGNYMEFPPEEQRKVHPVSKLKI